MFSKFAPRQPKIESSADDELGPLRGAPARIAENMDASLTLPLATSQRTIPIKLMEENQIRRLAVLNRDKRLVGIVSLGDLAVKTGDEALSGEALEQVSEPAAPKR